MRTRPSNAPAPVPSSRLLTLQQMAQYLGVSRSVAGSYVSRGYIKPVALPQRFADGPLRRLLLDRQDIDRFINEAKDTPHEATPCTR